MPKPDVWQLFWPFAGVVGAVAVLFVCISWIRSWLSENEDTADSDHEFMAQTRELVRQGVLTDEEFRLIKGRLAARIGGESQTPAFEQLPAGPPAPARPPAGESAQEHFSPGAAPADPADDLQRPA